MANKIDWPNHLIGFFSALFGILIAFELDTYREESRQKEELINSLAAVKEEIEHNLEIYKSNAENLASWLEYYKLTSNKKDNETIRLSKLRFAKLKSYFPNRYEEWKIIDESDSMVTLEAKGDFVIDILPQTGISKSSWQAAIYSGSINRIDNKLLVNLTKIYEWIEKDLNASDRASMEDALFSRFNNIDLIVDDFTRIQKVHSFKYGRIKAIYDQIEWTELHQ